MGGRSSASSRRRHGASCSSPGALAGVTGRPIETIDRLLGDAPHAVAGEHGGVVRHAPNALAERPDLPSPPAAWLDEAERQVAAFPGALLERKASGFARCLPPGRCFRQPCWR